MRPPDRLWYTARVKNDSAIACLPDDPQTLRDLIHRGLPIVDQLLALLHRRALQEELQRILDPADADQATA